MFTQFVRKLRVAMKEAHVMAIANIHYKVDSVLLTSIEDLMHAVNPNEVSMPRRRKMDAFLICLKCTRIVGENGDMQSDTVFVGCPVGVSCALPVGFKNCESSSGWLKT